MCVVHQDATDGLRRQRVEMRAILPGRVVLSEQSHERFVDQQRGLKRVTFVLTTHRRLGDAMQLRVNQRRQPTSRARDASCTSCSKAVMFCSAEFKTL